MFRACCECARTPHTSTHTFLGYHCLPVLFPSPSQNWLHSVPVLLYMNPFHHSYFIVDFIKPSQASMRYATYRHCLALLLFHFPSTPPFTTNDDSMLASPSIIFPFQNQHLQQSLPFRPSLWSRPVLSRSVVQHFPSDIMCPVSVGITPCVVLLSPTSIAEGARDRRGRRDEVGGRGQGSG